MGRGSVIHRGMTRKEIVSWLFLKEMGRWTNTDRHHYEKTKAKPDWMTDWSVLGDEEVIKIYKVWYESHIHEGQSGSQRRNSSA